MTVYLIHFAEPIGNHDNPRGQAQHYIGFCDHDLGGRIAEHRAGQGARIMAAVVAAGIEFTIAHTWSGDRNTERHLKNRHNARRLCPICRNHKGV